MEWLKTQFEWVLIQDPGSLLIAALGWPAVILCIWFSFAGVSFQKPRLLLIAALLSLPFSLYLLGANNWIGIAGPLIPLLLVAGWFTTKRKLTFISWSILGLLFSIFASLAYAVASQ